LKCLDFSLLTNIKEFLQAYMAFALHLYGVPSPANGTLEAFKEQLGKCRELTLNQENFIWE